MPPSLLNVAPVFITLAHPGDEPRDLVKFGLFVRQDSVGFLIDRSGDVFLRLEHVGFPAGNQIDGMLAGVDRAFTVTWRLDEGCRCGFVQKWYDDRVAELASGPPYP